MTHDWHSILYQVKRAARDRYAWPGGYPLAVVMSDGAVLCPDCARSEFRLIARATRDNDRDGWAAIGTEVFWGEQDEFCDHCNAVIASMYD